MSKTVVDGLETIEVQEEQCKSLSEIVGRGTQARIDHLQEMVAVREPGESVVICGMSETFSALAQGMRTSFELLDKRLFLAFGPAVGLSYGSPGLVGRGSLAFAF